MSGVIADVIGGVVESAERPGSWGGFALSVEQVRGLELTVVSWGEAPWETAGRVGGRCFVQPQRG